MNSFRVLTKDTNDERRISKYFGLGRFGPILGGWKDRLDELFEGDEFINIQCPRCAAKYHVTREMIV